jgi:hypothetical protein
MCREPLHSRGMMRRFFAVLVALIIIALPVPAADVYIVQGDARGPSIDRNTLVLWTTDAFFYNGDDLDAIITLLDASNGAAHRIGDTFKIAPHRSLSLTSSNRGWGSGTGDPLWVLRVDVPPAVLVDASLFIGWQSLTGPSPSTFRFAYGKARLPVFRSLTPPGQPQIHLATSLGPASNNSVEIQVPSRINVAIYNGGAVQADATIEIRQHCDDRVVTSERVSIPANTIIQVGGFEARTRDCPPVDSSGDSIRSVYTVVTVDQPSFSFVSNLSNAAIPTTSISITGTP